MRFGYTNTTFALYHTFSSLGYRHIIDEILGIKYPLQFNNLSWYKSSKNLNDEEKYYINSVTKPTSWSKK